MLQLEDAVNRILARIPQPVPEVVPLSEALGRVAAAPALSNIDVPPFANSSMDGYALQAADTQGASPAHPRALRLAGRIAAGQPESGSLTAGTCFRILTGSPLPPGADAVVMQEDTRIDPGPPETVQVLEPAAPGENIRSAGEDFSRGTVLANAGARFSVGHLAALAAAGLDRVTVGRRPTVAILPTGSELQDPGTALGPGHIYDSNRTALASLVAQAGGIPRPASPIPDVLESTRAALDRAFNEADVIVTCGGVSVGDLDFVKPALEQLGGELDFWKVAMKPGSPIAFGSCRGKLLFGLPGNPVSAIVTFLLLVRPALLRWQGAAQTGLPSVTGRLIESLENHGSRRHFMRVRLEPDGRVQSAGRQASHALHALAKSNGLIDVPPASTLAQGASVQVLLMEGSSYSGST
ncbi:MAG: gephyrin-like molybdotransferase Glp [Verrucomicrobiota bacterium]